jgi:hypothetical protein
VKLLAVSRESRSCSLLELVLSSRFTPSIFRAALCLYFLLSSASTSLLPFFHIFLCSLFTPLSRDLLTLTQPSTFNLQPSTFNLQPSTFNLQPSTFNLQPSTFNLLPLPSYPISASHLFIDASTIFWIYSRLLSIIHLTPASKIPHISPCGSTKACSTRSCTIDSDLHLHLRSFLSHPLPYIKIFAASCRPSHTCNICTPLYRI